MKNSRGARLLILTTVGLLSCGKEEAPRTGRRVIKFVSSLPHTGIANALSDSIANGIRIAIHEAGGKVGAWEIRYESWDDASPQRGGWDPAVEAANADRAIQDPDVMVYLGTYNSGAAKISIPKLNAASLVMISPANTYPGLTKPGRGAPNEPDIYRPTGTINYFRVVPADDIQGAVGAEWAKKLGARKVFVLHDRELYGKGIADIFKARAEALGLKILGEEGLDVKAGNYRSLAAKVKAADPDLVYLGATTQSNGGQVAKDLRAALYRGKLMVPDGCFDRAFIDSAGAENLNDLTYVTFAGVPAARLAGKGEHLYKTYKERYRSEPEAYAIYGYEAARVAIDAVRRADRKDRAAILKAVAETRDFDGLLGRWSFDANGDTTLRAMSGNAVRKGTFEFVEMLGSE